MEIPEVKRVSAIKRDHLARLAKERKRPDGRKPDEYRPIKIERNIIKKAEGSARVRIGNTMVLAGIQLLNQHQVMDFIHGNIQALYGFISASNYALYSFNAQPLYFVFPSHIFIPNITQSHLGLFFYVISILKYTIKPE